MTPGTPLWDWARRIYATPGAEAALLDLQDHHHQSVCLLLWAAWTATEGRALDPFDLVAAAALTRAWEDQVTGPLRTARRALKPAWPLIEEAGREALRARVKTDELNAERCLLEALEALTPRRAAAGAVMAARIAAAAAAWSSATPEPGFETALERLAQIFAAKIL